MGRGSWIRSAVLLGVGAALVLALVLARRLSVAETALAGLYGAAMGVSLIRPVILPASGGRVTVAPGMLLALLATSGLWPTVLALDVGLLVLFLTREQAEFPVLAVAEVGVLAGAAGLWGLVLVLPPTLLGQSRAVAALVAGAAGAWLAGRAVEGVALARARSEPFGRTYLAALTESPWTLAFYLTAAGILLLTTAMPWLHPGLVIGLAVVQYRLGSLLTQVFQDWAVDELIRRAGWSVQAYPGRQERVLQYAYRIGTALKLPAEQQRLLAYAAVLQDAVGDPPNRDLELATTPVTAATAAGLSRRIARAAERVARLGALAPVAQALRYRYAWWNGRGVPRVHGQEIPEVARVLAAANGLFWLLSPPPEWEDPLAANWDRETDCQGRIQQALEWLREQEGQRLDPMVAQAARRVLEENLALQRGSPERVPEILRRIRRLETSATWTPAPSGLSRWLRRFRALSGLDRLPPEVVSAAELNQLLGATTDLSTAADQVTSVVAELTGGCVFLALRDPGGGSLSIRSVRGFRRLSLLGRKLSYTGGAITRALLTHQTLVVHGLQTDPPGPLARAIALAEGVTRAVYLPLVARGRAVGLLFVGQRGGPAFTPRQISLLELVAGQAALAADNGLLLAEAEERTERVDEMRRFLGALIEQLPTGVLTVDLEGRIGLINEPARELLMAGGYPDLTVGDVFPRVMPAGPIWQALKGESVESYIWEPRPGVYVEVRSLPMRDEQGRVQGAMAIGWDITRVREMEQEVQRVARLADLGKLAAGAAHEIRNPLTAIRGFVQLLSHEAPPDTPESEYGEIILKEIDRIESIVSDMLLLARPADPNRQPVSLPQLLEDVLLLLGPELEAGEIAVEREYGAGEVRAWASSDRLRQVVLNLVRNGIEALAESEERRLILRAGREEGGAWFSITDTGPGIPPEHMGSLFAPFFTTKEQGTGLGLAICYAAVEALGGRIDVDSQPGQGATFRVWLPEPPAGKAAANRTPAHKAAAGGTGPSTGTEPTSRAGAQRPRGLWGPSVTRGPE